MQNLRHGRLARQLNETALALLAEARVTDPQSGKELRQLATELDRVRVSLLAEDRALQVLPALAHIEAA